MQGVSFLLFLISSTLFSKELMSSYNYLNNGLLPSGVFTFGVNIGRTKEITNRYNDNGSLISNRAYNSKRLSYNDLVNSSKTKVDKVLAASAFKAFDLNLSSEAGFVENNINIQSSSKVYVLGYGINEKSNLLLILPVVNVSFDVKSHFYASKSYNQLIDGLKESGQRSKARYLEDIKRAPLKTRLNENEQVLPVNVESVANIYLNYRLKLDSTISDTQLVVPAGRKYSTRDFVDFRLNDNSFGLKQGFGKDFIFKKNTLSLYGTYHLRTSFSMDYRVPRNDNDPLSSDVERNLKIKYGDQAEISGQYLYQWSETFNTYINLRYMYSFADSYEGKDFSSSRYEILEKDSESRSVSAQVGLSVNTISAFLSQKFLLPIDFNIQVSKLLYGKNTFESDWIAFNLMVFYK